MGEPDTHELTLHGSAELESALDRLDVQRETSRRFVTTFAKRNPAAFRQAALAYLERGGPKPTERYLIFVACREGDLLGLLKKPDALPIQEATAVARLWKDHVADLDTILARSLREASVPEIERALHILAEITASNRILPLLIPLVKHSNKRIREKAALIFGKFCHNATFAKSSLQDSASRVRANVLEGLWSLETDPATDTLLAALADPNNRVAANAALGLHLRGHPSGARTLLEMASDSRADFRASAAWAMGETGDSNFLLALERLGGDSDGAVARNAMAAIRKTQRRRDGRREPGTKTKQHTGEALKQPLSASSQGGGPRGLSPNDTKNQDPPPLRTTPGAALDKRQLISILTQYITSVGVGFVGWYVGACNDPRRLLFEQHRVPESSGRWIYRLADGPETAREVEDFFVGSFGTDGRRGFEKKPAFVYAYLKEQGTNP